MATPRRPLRAGAASARNAPPPDEDPALGEEGELEEAAPAPFQGAPYSQAIASGGFVFISGQLGLKPGDTEISGTIGEQTEQIFANLKAILETAGSRLDWLVKSTVFLARMEEFAEMNEVYKRHAGTEPPARSTVQAAKLPAGALVEIEAVAHL